MGIYKQHKENTTSEFYVNKGGVMTKVLSLDGETGSVIGNLQPEVNIDALTADITLTRSDARKQILTPDNDWDVTLDNSFKAGDTVEIHNDHPTNLITLKPHTWASAADNLDIFDKGKLILTAKQDAPTTKAHWYIEGQRRFAHVYLTSNIADLTSANWQQILYDSVVYDNNNMFNSGNSRIIPDLPGFYRVAFVASIRSTTSNQMRAHMLSVYKNTTEVNAGTASVFHTTTTSKSTAQVSTSSVVYMNGVDDYLKADAYASTGSGTWYIQGEARFTYLQIEKID